MERVACRKGLGRFGAVVNFAVLKKQSQLAPSEIPDRIRQAAADEGFDLCGIAPVVTSSGFHHLVDWIESGYAAEMDYFQNRLSAYEHPGGVLAGAKSIVVMSFPYPNAGLKNDSQADAQSMIAGQGKVARYAWPGLDYHDVIHPKLKRICKMIQAAAPQSTCRGVVDTAPIMEREIAQLAGLGWRGKNTLLLNKHRGSYFFLACILLDLELPPDQPHVADHCGTCTACLDACPTDAFPAPGVLDASKCISYLTIEHRGPIDPSLRPKIGDWFFGCDVCQEVCPWNQKHGSDTTEQNANETTVTALAEPETLRQIEMDALFRLDDEAFRRRFRKTPLWRTRRRGVLRNAAIVLGNQRDARSLGSLTIGLSEKDAVVRSACVWAIRQIGGNRADAILKRHRQTETDPQVIAELDC